MGRMIVMLAGLCGAGGVALSAFAAHAGGANLATAASMLLFAAPALLATGLIDRGRLLGIGALALAIGTLLFAGDLVARHFLEGRLFPMAAPAGGITMIVGWLMIAAGGLTLRR